MRVLTQVQRLMQSSHGSTGIKSKLKARYQIIFKKIDSFEKGCRYIKFLIDNLR